MKLEGIAIQDVIDYLEEHKKYVSMPMRERIAKFLAISLPVEQESSEPVDILDEVKEQMKLVRQIRLQVIADGYNTRDMKDLVSTSNTLFATLTKYSNDIENQEKVKRIESATLEALKLLESEVQEVFFDALTKYLEK